MSATNAQDSLKQATSNK